MCRKQKTDRGLFLRRTPENQKPLDNHPQVCYYNGRAAARKKTKERYHSKKRPARLRKYRTVETMKKTRVFCSLIALFLLLSVLTPAFAPRALAAYSIGDRIQYGTYPQTRVTDSTLISALNAAPKKWKTYNYPSYEQSGGTMRQTTSDMQYADFFSGSVKYRAVKCSKSLYVAKTTFSGVEYLSYQAINGYAPGTTYYFRYEPVRWIVMEPTTGEVICESILAAHAWEEPMEGTLSPSIRAWLNEDFFETAFTDQQKVNVKYATLYDTPYSDMPGTSPVTDRIYLLSFNEYEATSLTLTGCKGTDYAKCMGLYVDEENGASWWLLRSGEISIRSAGVHQSGQAGSSFSNIASVAKGARPVCRLYTLKNDTAVSDKLFSGDPGGSGRGDVDGDGKITAADARLALRRAVDLETYAKGSAKYTACDMNGDGSVTAEDARLILRAAVGL